MSKVRRSTEFKNNSRVIDMDEARAKRQKKRMAQRETRRRQEEAKNTPETRGKRAIRRKRNRTRLMAALVVVGIIGVLIFSGLHVAALLKEKHSVDKQHEALLKEKAELEQQLENAQDKDAVEDVARQQLRLIKPGEVLYMFPAGFGENTEEKDAAKDQEDKAKEDQDQEEIKPSETKKGEGDN